MTRLLLICTASTITEQLAKLQTELRGVVPSGPPIKWDSRDDRHTDYLAPEEKVQ